MTIKYPTGLPLFAIGFLSIGFQIYLLREFLIVFNGFELVLGIALAFWILFTGIGSFLGRHFTLPAHATMLSDLMLLLAGIMPVFLLFTVHLLKLWLVPYGSVPDIMIILIITSAVQLPFCLINGLLFTIFSAGNGNLLPSRSYAIESMGSAFAGVLVNFVLLWVFEPGNSVWFLSLVYLLLIGGYFLINSRKSRFVLMLNFAMILLISVAHLNIQGLTDAKTYPGQKLITKKETPYGQVVITSSGSQLNYYENGMLLFSSGNEISNEENVHYAMAQHPNPRNVLLISGGFSGMINEILKYQPARIDYVEINPSLILIASRFTRQLEHRAVVVHPMDARRFIQTTGQRYDVVIVNLPPPSTLQLNRYYTQEFMDKVKQLLKPGAVVSWSLPASGEYQGEIEKKSTSLLWSSLNKNFPNALIIPGYRNYFLASDSSLSLDIPGLIMQRKIDNLYVNQYYLDYQRIRERSSELTPKESGSSTLTGWDNHDFYPIGVWFQTAYSFDFFKLDYRIMFLAFLLVLILLILTLNPLNAGLFTGGFTLASSQIMLIFGLQVLCGNIFFLIGSAIMLFMIGLALGAYIRIGQQNMNKKVFQALQIAMAVFSCILPICLIFLGSFIISDIFIYLTMSILALTGSFITGLEYQVASSLSSGKQIVVVSKNYSADMFGAASGVFAVSLFLIPLAGILFTGIILAILNLASAGYSRLRISS